MTSYAYLIQTNSAIGSWPPKKRKRRKEVGGRREEKRKIKEGKEKKTEKKKSKEEEGTGEGTGRSQASRAHSAALNRPSGPNPAVSRAGHPHASPSVTSVHTHTPLPETDGLDTNPNANTYSLGDLDPVI